MSHSAITDFRLGLERRLPRAEISAAVDPSQTWSCLISYGSRHYLVAWSDGSGFEIAGHRIRNVDAAISAVAKLFAGMDEKLI